MTAAVELRALTKSFESEGGAVAAVRAADLVVARGEFVAIMGPSGSGKSTLLHCMGGLTRPTSGQVLVDGEDLAALDDRRLAEVRRHRVGFVFQAFNLVPVLTLEENVALPLVIAGERRGAVDERVRAALGVVGLEAIATRRVAALSGGEQQRAAIARALVTSPAVLLADEPTGNLDSTSGRHVLRQLLELHRGGQTIVLVTHDVKVAGVAERLFTMRDGELHEHHVEGDRGVDREWAIDRLLDTD